MHDAPTSITIPALFALLRRNAALLIFTIGLAAGTSVGLSAATDPVYESRSAVAFSDDSGDLQALGIPASPEFQPDKQAAAQAERITRPDVIDRVRKNLRIDLPVSEIQDAISTQVEPASNLVSITAEASTGELAARLANGFAVVVRDDATRSAKRRYRDVAASSERRAERLRGDRNAARRAIFEDQAARLLALANFAAPVDVVRDAEVASSPSSPKPVRNAVLAALLGAILGTGMVFLRQSFDRRLREPADVQEHLDLPVYGFLATSTLGRTPLVTGKSRASDEDVEAFRILRTNVAFIDVEGDVRTILVTSPLPEEGKSTTAAGLAWAEALTGRRTLLVDCDLRRPTVADRLGIDPAPGLSDFLMGEVGPTEILRTVSVAPGADSGASQVVVIPAGRPVVNHAELLESPRFGQFLKEVSEVYDRIVLDSAPLLPVSDTLALLPQVDAVLLCLRLGQTSRDDAQAARAALDHFPTKPVGLVLTAADKSQSPYYVGSYAYTQPAAQKAG